MKLPGYEEGIDVKAVSESINKNIVDVITASEAQTRNEAQRHPHIGIKDFDQREVYIADKSNAYRLELCIANLTDGTKIAYVKRYIERAGQEIAEKIKKAETAEQIRLNQPLDGEDVETIDTTSTDNSIPQDSKSVNTQNSLKSPSQKIQDLNRDLENVKNGKASAEDALSKYVKDGTITTELYNELLESYGAIPEGENAHRTVKVPQRTAKDKKVSQTVRTILEAQATPDTAVPTIEKMVEDGVFSYDVYTDKQAISDAAIHL
jgi:hypothetical protein